MLDPKKIENRILNSKKKLRSQSKDYKKNFLKIHSFIKKEVNYILNLKKNKKNIIPEISFNNLAKNNTKIVNEIHRRGCVIIRDVFKDSKMQNWNNQLEKYIEDNNYYEDQKKKANIDQYFSELKSGKPQIFGLYWSKPQIEIRQSKELDTVKKWLNKLWKYESNNQKIFDPDKELVYADRIRRREPGDSTLGLSPHCDAGSVERWIDEGYQNVYKKIFTDEFENFDPFDARFRDQTNEIESPAVSHVFRTFQGWVALTHQGPSDGTLQLIPIAKSIAFILTRALEDDVNEKIYVALRLLELYL